MRIGWQGYQMKTIFALGAVLLLLVAQACAAADAKKIAITIDDLPVASVEPISMSDKQRITDRILAALVRHHVKAVGFVNEDKIYASGEVDAGIGLLKKWLDAGMELGNHNFGHLGLFKTPLDHYEDAIVKGEVITRWLLAARGAAPKYYRYPFNQTGNTLKDKEQIETFLSTRGYTIAPFTIEHDDYYYACVYDRGYAQNKQVKDFAQLSQSYLAHLGASIETFETMSAELFSRQIPQIFLIHASRLNADTLDRTLDEFIRRGYSFVSLDEALRDAAYRLATGPSGKFGPSWLARWARTQNRQLTVYGQPDPAGWIAVQHQRLCEP